MNKQIILDRVSSIIKKEFNIQLSKQHLNISFLELGIDSIGFMMLCVLTEEALSCVIKDDIMLEKAYNQLTISDFVNSIKITNER